MNRKDFQRLAAIRLSEAKILLDNRKYDGSYYLSGYVIECALKACIAKQIRRFEFPNKKLANNCYTHDITTLLKTANLNLELDRNIQSDSIFLINWNIAKDWSEESRYLKIDKQRAIDIYSAVSDLDHGVLKWLQQHW